MTKAKIGSSSLRPSAITALDLAFEEGAGFAINRLEDHGWRYKGPDYEASRQSAIEAMVRELHNAFWQHFEN